MRPKLVAVGALAFAVMASGVPAVASTLGAPDASGSVWLCGPGVKDNPCESDLETTVVHADGSRTAQRARPAKKPPIDCFYVYPTVSRQRTQNANLNIDPEEIAVAQTQASRFSQVCQVYAPMYPQLTVASIKSGGVRSLPRGAATAYAGVVSAWRDYLAHDNNGRGVVFIGHSQGAGMLTALLKREIDPNPRLRRQVVSALLIGGNVTVAAGQDVGGSFQNIPACRTTRQTGCVVAYSSFDAVPPPGSFGRPGRGVSALPGRTATTGLEVLCVNPAAPGGGTAPLQPYFRTTPFPSPVGRSVPSRYKASTPWVAQPRLYTGKCENQDGASWLQVDDVGTASDTRPRVRPVLGPRWGLHLVDVNLALGDLLDLVRDEAAAYHVGGSR